MIDAARSYLLDTYVLVWLSSDLGRIPKAVLHTLEDLDSKLFVSTACFWELAIKQSQGKFTATLRLDHLAASRGIRELAISSKYIDTVRELPMLHGDPFDRMMVAQAMVEGMVLVTADRRLSAYPVAVLQV